MRFECLELGLQEGLAALAAAHGVQLLRVRLVQPLLDLEPVCLEGRGVAPIHEAQLERLVARLHLSLRDLERLPRGDARQAHKNRA